MSAERFSVPNQRACNTAALLSRWSQDSPSLTLATYFADRSDVYVLDTTARRASGPNEIPHQIHMNFFADPVRTFGSLAPPTWGGPIAVSSLLRGV